ncbi:S-type pyocin domain-containing protein [Pseudomonas synxantha]|uniref:Uncharacterized protein n=1 Tax=Pseudomonas synxantha TaxID=47883 RepID=A0ACC6JIQ8_9PSED|nr:S-type pyocin domain-containing protein [Pseudomonas synxantha]MDR6606100.1 hypothetical protein [Pseudomonas synxantha]
MSDQNWTPGKLNIDTPIVITPDKEQDFGPYEGGGYGNFIPPANFRMTTHIAENALSVRSKIETEYQAKLNSLPEQIQSELSINGAKTTQSALPTDPEAIGRDQYIVNTLLQLKSERLQNSLTEANSFYGSDPHSKSKQEYISTFNNYLKHHRSAALRTQQHWMKSYTAGYAAKLYSESIRLLTQRSNQLNAAYAAAQARQAEAQARQVAEQEARNRALQQAETQRLAKLEEDRRAAQVEENRRTEEKRIKQLENERKVSDAQRRFEETLQQFLATRFDNPDEQLRWLEQRYRELSLAHEKAIDAEQQLTSDIRQKNLSHRQQLLDEAHRTINSQQAATALANKIKAANTFSINLATATNNAVVTPVVGMTALAGGASTTFDATLHSALSKLSRAVFDIGSRGIPFATLMLYSPSLGNSDRFVVSVPVSNLAPNLEANWHQLAEAGGEVDLPIRLGSKTRGDLTTVFAAAMRTPVSSNVKVLNAILDARENVYRYNTNGLAGRHLTWTPASPPGNENIGPTTSPALPNGPSNYPGGVATPVEPYVETFPEGTHPDFDDCVFCFPIDSGIDPIYVMFNRSGPRYQPGTATGMGQAVGDNWLGATSEAGGAPIPAPIADKLRGQDFRNFDEFREKFWSAVSNDAELSKKLGPLNKAITKNGYSPYAPRSEQVGGREKLEIHHVHPISKGGEVYNIDNMAITTPKAHISEHSNNNGVPQ